MNDNEDNAEGNACSLVSETIPLEYLGNTVLQSLCPKIKLSQFFFRVLYNEFFLMQTRGKLR